MPYDVPMQSSWQHDGVSGYASYKVADSVTTHDARGVGVYCGFDNAVVSANAVEGNADGGRRFLPTHRHPSLRRRERQRHQPHHQPDRQRGELEQHVGAHTELNG
jgi:hypothetical protein